MQHAMKQLIIFSVLFTLSGCGQPDTPKVDQYVSVQQKCVAEEVPAPIQERCTISKSLPKNEAINEALKCQERNRIREKEARELQTEKAKVCQ